jgi:hypothetical protein
MRWGARRHTLTPMTFEEVLAILLGWVGRRVSVAVATAGDAPIIVANVLGEPRAGD